MDSVYELYRRGCDLLEHGDHMAAIVPLTRARELEPTKTSIREALGRALFHAQRYERAAEEFQAVAVAAPTNDYALFCLGRSMSMSLSAAPAGIIGNTLSSLITSASMRQGPSFQAMAALITRSTSAGRFTCQPLMP